MKRTSGRFRLAALSVLVFCLLACAYQRQVVPFKMPSAYPNATEAAGATIEDGNCFCKLSGEALERLAS